MNCKNCKYADVSNKPHYIKTNNTIFFQNGKNNVFCCCNDKNKSLNFENGKWSCSAYKNKEG